MGENPMQCEEAAAGCSGKKAAIVSSEEALVAELELLGVRYLSRQTRYRATHLRPPDRLLAELVQQPNARVREALIAVLLSCPRYAEFVPTAVDELGATNPSAATLLRLLYTAAVYLQPVYRQKREPSVVGGWYPLPDLYPTGFGLPSGDHPLAQKLYLLGQAHRKIAGVSLNWSGTYENVAKKLARRCEMERQWNQSR
jgi:hypothetical protein